MELSPQEKGKRYLFIINPISGINSKVGVPNLIRKAFEKSSKEVFISYTKYPGHARDLVRLADELGFYAVVVVGGDGTINEVASAVTKTRLKMGIIPMGSGNGLARSLEIPMSVSKALDVVLQENIKPIDYGVANDRPFFCTFGVGFDAEVTQKYDENHFRGVFSYILSTIDSYIRHKPIVYKITIGDRTFEQKAFLITCANADQYGNNAFIAPDALLDDGLLDLVVVREMSPIETPIFAVQLFTKRINHNTSIDVYRASSFVIERPVDDVVHIDGESAFMSHRIDLKIQSKKLEVFVPKTLSESPLE